MRTLAHLWVSENLIMISDPCIMIKRKVYHKNDTFPG
jgi:hypothetical protein